MTVECLQSFRSHGIIAGIELVRYIVEEEFAILTLLEPLW